MLSIHDYSSILNAIFFVIFAMFLMDRNSQQTNFIPINLPEEVGTIVLNALHLKPAQILTIFDWVMGMSLKFSDFTNFTFTYFRFQFL